MLLKVSLSQFFFLYHHVIIYQTRSVFTCLFFLFIKCWTNKSSWINIVVLILNKKNTKKTTQNCRVFGKFEYITHMTKKLSIQIIRLYNTTGAFVLGFCGWLFISSANCWRAQQDRRLKFILPPLHQCERSVNVFVGAGNFGHNLVWFISGIGSQSRSRNLLQSQLIIRSNSWKFFCQDC